MANYPLLKYRFRVSGISDNPIGFTEVDGLTMNTEVIEYREGDMTQQFPILQPAMQKFAELTLKRGLFADSYDLVEWFNLTTDGGSEFLNDGFPARRDINIELLNNNGNSTFTWQITKAFPIKLSFDGLNSTSNETIIQELALRYEQLKVLVP